MVTYNGETTNFSGEGSPNPQKLVIPYKDRMDPVLRAAMLSLEQWCNNLVSPSGSGYASLTGPGETTTPGDLAQDGGFSVTTPYGVALDLPSTGNGPYTIGVATHSQAYLYQNDAFFWGEDLTAIGAIPGGSPSANTDINGGTVTVTTTDLALDCTQLSFFGTGTVTQPTVTGAAAGNTALDSLLTALADLGLIINSATP